MSATISLFHIVINTQGREMTIPDEASDIKQGSSKWAKQQSIFPVSVAGARNMVPFHAVCATRMQLSTILRISVCTIMLRHLSKSTVTWLSAQAWSGMTSGSLSVSKC